MTDYWLVNRLSFWERVAGGREFDLEAGEWFCFPADTGRSLGNTDWIRVYFDLFMT